MQSLQEKFAELEKQGHKNSKEYTEMVKAAKNLQLVAEAIAEPKKWEKLGIEQVPNEDQVDSIVKRAEDIAVKAVEKYVNEKGNPYTEFGKKRLAVAKDLQEELSKSITIFREERTDDMLFLYTDGVPEATNANEELFGLERMTAALNTDLSANPEQLLSNVKSAVDAFVGEAPQFDDLTMLAIRLR